MMDSSALPPEENLLRAAAPNVLTGDAHCSAAGDLRSGSDRFASGRAGRRERLILTAILIVAALLRLGWPGIVQFSADEARIISVTMDIAQGRRLPLFGGGTSFGLPTPPVAAYVYAPAALLWDDPLWLTWFTAALNMVALAFFWQLCRRGWGARVALCATLLFATHPWAVIASRKIWEPNLIAFFSIPWALTGVLAFRERKATALVAHLALLSVLAQLHYSGLALAPVTALMLLLSRKHLDRRMLAAGLALAAVLAIPFLYGFVETQAEGWRAGLSFVSGAARIDGESLRLWWITATGSDIHSLAGSTGYQAFSRTLPNLDVLRWALGGLVLAGIGWWLWEAVRDRRDGSANPGTLMVLWALAPMLVLLRHVKPLYLHYYVISIPPLCLAAGLVLGRLVSARDARPRWGAVALAIALGMAQAATTLAILRFVGEQATPGGFGVPLQSQEQAMRRVTALGPPALVLADGEDPRLSAWRAVFGLRLRSMPHRLLDGQRLALFPAQDSTVLVTPGADVALRAYSEAGVLSAADIIPNRRGEEPFYVLRLPAGFTPNLQPVAEPRRFANGAELVGYRVDGVMQPGQAVDWWIAWRVWSTPANPLASYHFFNHVVNERGAHLAQADGPAMAAEAWSVGDLVVQRFRLDWPAQAQPGPLWIRVGMYTYPEMEVQPLLDANGQPAGEFVTLGPFPVD